MRPRTAFSALLIILAGAFLALRSFGPSGAPLPFASGDPSPVPAASPAEHALSVQPPTTPAQSAAASPTSQSIGALLTGIFGDHGPVTLAEIPPGPFRESLEKLTPADRSATLVRLVDLQVPRNQITTLLATPHGGLIHICACGPHRTAHAPADHSPAPALAATTKGPVAAKVSILTPPALSSLPGATRVLYLDFNGMTVSNTAWNTAYGVSTYQARPYDIDGDPTTFNDAEQSVIRNVWERVSEDFAPFQINVTTVEPSSFTLTTGRVLLTHARDANYNYVPGGADSGGVAYLGVFGQSNYAFLSPAWVIVDNMDASDPADLAEVTAHEFGHNLGLNHDGTNSSGGEYYRGHGSGALSWGPIMGASYNRTITTFSKGEYYNASNTFQDDLAIIATRVPYRADLVPDTLAGAVSLGGFGSTTQGMIERNTDSDLFALTNASGRIQLSINTFNSSTSTRGNNLDIEARLLNAFGTVIDTYAAPTSPDLVINAVVPPGTYYLRVSSGSAGSPFSNPASGYTSYGSIGTYSIYNETTDAPPPDIHVNPLGAALPLGSTHTFFVSATMAPPHTLSYQWRRNGASIPGATESSLTVSDLTLGHAGSYTCRVTSSANSSALSEPAPLVVYRDTPQTHTVNPNASFTLPALLAGDIDDYQWTHDGVALQPTGGSRLVLGPANFTLADIQAPDGGEYVLAPVFNGQTLPVGAVTLVVRPPVILTADPIVTVYRGESISLPITRTHEELSYRIIGLPSGIGYTPATGALHTGIPGALPADYPLRVIGTDSFGNRGSVDFTLRVLNRPFATGLPSTLRAYLGTDPVVPLDPDIVGARFTYLGLPTGIGYNPATGALSSRRPPAPAGEYPVSLTIADAYGNTGTTFFTIVVEPLPADAATAYTGLVARHQTGDSALGGSFQLTPVLAKGLPTGTYTGSLLLGATRHTLAGRLAQGAPDAPRLLTATATAKGRPTLTLSLTVPTEGSPATGEISPAGAALAAWPTPYSSRQPATAYVGKHVFALLPPEDAAALGAPAGAGIGTLAIAKTGVASWTALLPDGSRLTGSTPLGRDGQVPVFGRLATPGGSLLGPLQVATPGRAIDGTLSWLRLPAPAKTYAKTALYRDGFGPVEVTALGGPLSPPARNVRVLGLGATTPNLRVSFLGAGLTEAQLAALALPPVTVNANNTVTRPTAAAANPAALSLALKPTSGTFSGSFVLKNPNPLKPTATITRKVAFQGVLLDGRAVGYFLLPGLKSDPVQTPPTLSGAVVLEPLPAE